MEQKSHGISDFEKLYSRYYPKMVRFVTAYVLTRTDAENIVQDIFLDLLEKENVGSINNLNAYLFRMEIRRFPPSPDHAGEKGGFHQGFDAQGI